jgi:hypothetical protein
VVRVRDPVGEACEAVQAAAAGKSKAEIRRMLVAELRSREAPPLVPELVDVLLEKIAAGTYVPGEPLVSIRRFGLLDLPFIGKPLRRALQSTREALNQHTSEEGMGYGVVWIPEHFTDDWPKMSWMCPHPPGRDFYATKPDEVPPPARLLPDTDLRERMPELFELRTPPPRPPGTAPIEAEMVMVWLEESGGTVAVRHWPGRIGVLNVDDADAYLPLVRAAGARFEAVAAMVDIRVTADGLLPATVRVLPDRDPAPHTH